MKLFTHEAPVSKGRIKVTVEYDATFVREMFRLLGDAPDELPKFIGKLVALMESLDK